MRLSRIERDVIVREARESFGPDARVKLFGSRTDDRRRGGDIDLLVQSDVDATEALRRKIRFLVGVKSKLGDQRIDVVIAEPGDRRPIVEEALREGVAL